VMAAVDEDLAAALGELVVVVVRMLGLFFFWNPPGKKTTYEETDMQHQHQGQNKKKWKISEKQICCLRTQKSRQMSRETCNKYDYT